VPHNLLAQFVRGRIILIRTRLFGRQRASWHPPSDAGKVCLWTGA
jgi:hypothetical protein